MRNKYLIFITGVLLIIIFFSGFKTYTGKAERLVKDANRLYKQKEYEKAGKIYSSILDKDHKEPKLNYNMANVKYQIDSYQEALEFYKKGPDSPNKYLLMGNTAFRMAEENKDQMQKMKLYQQAMGSYKDGIVRYPENLNLKYNYEYVKKKLDMQNQQKNKDQNKDDREQDNKKDRGDEQKQNQSEDSGDSKQEQQNKKQSQEDQDDNEQDSREDNMNKDGNQGDNQEQKKAREEEPEPQKQSPEEKKAEQDKQQIMQILNMLEKQEEESLKNNQTLKPGPEKEEKYDW